jgi:N-acetylmuramoyl-L-alanine amidase
MEKSRADTPLICIDPGHGGGGHPGACNRKKREADAALDISLRVRTLLEDGGLRVLMTRVRDSDVCLKDRCDAANKANAAAFIAIHLNAAKSKAAYGAETWRYDTSNPVSIKLAGSIQKSLINETGARDRGVKVNRTFYTLRHTVMPSVVVECGFISNDDEAEKLWDDDYRDRIARGVARGILETFSARVEALP